MRFFLFTLSIIGLIFSQALHAASLSGATIEKEKIPTVMQAKKLIQILSLDKRELTKQIEIKRRILLSWLVRDFSSLARTWSLKPTYDSISRYTPHLQKYALSCEIAALEMVLRSLGSDETEDTIIARMPFFEWSLTGGIWWDPDREFVWSITGSQRLATGYGIYPWALAKTIEGDFYTEVFSLSGDTIATMDSARQKMSAYLSKIQSDDHVILWGDWCTNSENEDGIVKTDKSTLLRLFPIAGKNECQRTIESRIMNWVTPDGIEISWVSWEHAFVLLGYVGSLEDPTHIIVWDTDTGRHIYPAYEWMRKWSTLGYRALLIRDFE
jgi:Peptidase_C39 like family